MIHDSSLLEEGKEKRFFIDLISIEHKRTIAQTNLIKNGFQRFINENTGLFLTDFKNSRLFSSAYLC